MSNSRSIKVKHYYGLRLIIVIYRVLTMLTSIVVVASAAYIVVDILNTPMGARTLQMGISWAAQLAGLFIAGGLLALTFYVLAQLVESQMDQTRSLRELVTLMRQQSKMLEALTAEKAEQAAGVNLSQRRERISHAQLAASEKPSSASSSASS